MGDNQVAFIVGGATGMGFASARRLMRRGLDVGLTGRRESKLGEARDALLGEFPDRRVAVYAADASDEAQAAASIAWLAAELGAPDVFIDCAGSFEPVDFTDMDVASWAGTMNTTLNSCVYPTVAATKLMKQRGTGRVIFIGSTSGVVSEPGTAHYCAAKAAVHSLTRSLCVDLTQYGILTNAVAPGWVHTEMVDEFITNADPESFARLNPAGRVGLPDEIANVVEYLSLDSPEYLNGAVIMVDGGQTTAAPVI